MPTSRTKYLSALGLVIAVGLAATSGAASAPATASHRAADSAQAGSKIAFLRGNELYVVSADGSGQRRLTRNAALMTDGMLATPAWSPDGQKIVFQGRRGGAHHGLYVVNADGSGQQRLSRRGRAPAWSPDGQRIAFFAGPKIYVMNADGSEHRALANTQPGRRTSLAWSPDGRKLVFLEGGVGCGDFCFHLYVVNADGSSLQDVTPTLVGVGGNGVAVAPVWSPNGRKIAFASSGSVYVMSADGSGRQKLSRNADVFTGPAWSPDGRKIAFLRPGGRTSELYVMNADGSGQRKLTRNAGITTPAWSPDGRKIAFFSDRDRNSEVYVMNADGSGQRNVTRSRLDERWLAWSPMRR